MKGNHQEIGHLGGPSEELKSQSNLDQSKHFIPYQIEFSQIPSGFKLVVFGATIVAEIPWITGTGVCGKITVGLEEGTGPEAP